MDIAAVAPDYFSRAVLAKAVRGVDQVDLHAPVDYPERLDWTVTGSNGTSRYRVNVLGPSGYLTCTCPHGRHAGGHARCYHVASVLAYAGLLDMTTPTTTTTTTTRENI